MTYNKSEIMKKAHQLRKNIYGCTPAQAMSYALREAWAIAKENLGKVAATEINVGDTIAVEGYGGYDDNNFHAVVTKVEPYKIRGCSMDFVVIHFGVNNICKEVTELVKKVA